MDAHICSLYPRVYVCLGEGNTAHRNHMAAEIMIEKGCIPREWAATLSAQVDLGSISEGLELRIRRDILKKIRNLKKYFGSAPVFEDDEAKRIVFEAMTQRENVWMSGDVLSLLSIALSEGDLGDS